MCISEPQRQSRPARQHHALLVSRGRTTGHLSNRISGIPGPTINSPSPPHSVESQRIYSPPSASLAPRERPLTSMARLLSDPPHCMRDEVVLDPSSDAQVVQEIHGTMERVPHLTASFFKILPSIHFRTIPRPLRAPLSLIPPEHAYISCISGGDLAMTLCVFFDF